MNYVRVGGYIPPQPIEDYNDLPNIPVISQDLTASWFTPIANTYYKHTGATTASYTNGVIYYYNSTGYIALDGSAYGLATVAKTGSYNDLSNKPTIPDAANNGTLTIQKNGTNVATFGANQSTNTTANITVPTKASDIKALPISGGSITGDLAVGGNLTINGTTTTVDSTTLQVKDKLIEVAKDNTAKLTTPAGIVVPKYDGTSYGALVIDGDGNAQVGDVKLDASGNIDVTNSDLQILATREGLTDGNLVKWDGTKKTLVPDTTVASNASSALSKANANATEISNIKNGTTKVKSSEHADTADSATSAGTATKATEAMNVTENIKGHAIADIFENDGTTAKKATSAGTADKVANGLTIANATFDGSKPLTIGTSGKHIEIMGGSAASPNSVSIGLKYGNLMPSSYNKVTIDGYGIVVDGENVDYLTSHQSIKSINTNNTAAQTVNASEAIAGSGTINLHKVAKTGSYNDLLYKPTIPAAANNGTLTIQKNGTDVATFTANQSTNSTANITVPVKVSELTNDSGFTTNKGTITGINMNGASKGTSGVVDLGTVITAHQDISGKANLSGGNTFSGNQVITGYLDIRGTAAEKHLKTRGIGGSDGNGNSSDLYLQYSSNYKTYFGNTAQSSLNADGSISINGKTAATTDQIPDISGKQDKLTAGSNITISGNTISAVVPTDVVKYTAQTLTDAQKSQARSNIGAGTSNFSGNYNDLTNPPTIPTFTLSGTTLTITTN